MELKKLTREQLEEAKKCTTEEAKRAFIEKQKIQLSDEDLNRTVGGGGIIPDVLKCEKCGATFESYTEAMYHVFWEHFIGGSDILNFLIAYNAERQTVLASF